MRLGIFLCLALLCIGAVGAHADVVHLRNGTAVEGDLNADAYGVVTADHGELMVPVESIRSISFSDTGAVTLVLVDGQSLNGRLQSDKILLDRGLFANSYGIDEISLIEVRLRSESRLIEMGTPVRLMLAERLTSAAIEGRQEVRFCVAEDVYVGTEIVITKGTPAIGEISAARGAAAGSQQGEVGVRLRFILGPDGQRLSITGSGEFAGGLDASNFVGGGLLGFLGKGRDAVVPAGTVFDAETATAIEWESSSEESMEEPWTYCRRFFRFDGVDEVPLEEVDIHQAYAPFGTSLVGSLPVTPLSFDVQVTRSFRNLLAFDTYIQSMTVTPSESRRTIKFVTTWTLVVLPSHDKSVDIEVSIVSGLETLCRASRANIDAEEKKSRRVFITVKCDRDRIESASAEAPPRLRVKMRVRE